MASAETSAALAALEREEAELELELSQTNAELTQVKMNRLNLENALLHIQSTMGHLIKKNDLKAQEQELKLILILMIKAKICDLLDEELRLSLLVRKAVEKCLELKDNLMHILKEECDNLALELQVAEQKINEDA